MRYLGVLFHHLLKQSISVCSSSPLNSICTGSDSKESRANYSPSFRFLGTLDRASVCSLGRSWTLRKPCLCLGAGIAGMCYHSGLCFTLGTGSCYTTLLSWSWLWRSSWPLTSGDPEKICFLLCAAVIGIAIAWPHLFIHCFFLRQGCMYLMWPWTCSSCFQPCNICKPSWTWTSRKLPVPLSVGCSHEWPHT